ncbi:biopolymer transporter ExbD [candidate division KSB1 bacterium]|nr:biopolymer transporter ExbD [candidate division KSB1 bacterium]
MTFQTNRKIMVMFSAISLTDIVLLLLIFFLLSSSFIIQPGIKVNLPKAVSSDKETTNRIYITITRNGSIYLNQQQISTGDLGLQLKQTLAEQPGKLVVIQADKNLTLERTIEVIDIAKMSGAERFMIATQQGL